MLTVIDLDRPEEAKKTARKLYEAKAYMDALDAAYVSEYRELFGEVLKNYSLKQLIDLCSGQKYDSFRDEIILELKAVGKSCFDKGEYREAIEAACASKDKILFSELLKKLPLSQIFDFRAEAKYDCFRQEINLRLREEEWIGETIVFGNYGGVPIRWTVLDIIDGKKLLISKEALDYRRYNDTFTHVTWETCTLRKWLNSVFLNEAFSPRERERIAETVIQNPDNPDFKTKGGNDTKDKIFLLSIREVQKYFEDGNDRVCRASGRAKKDGAWTDSPWSCWWWLRSPGNRQYNAANVHYYGIVNSLGYYVSSGDYAVRPAFFLNP